MAADLKVRLNNLIGKVLIVKMMWGHQYKGYLTAVDNDMNLRLLDTEEYVDNKITGIFGDVSISCGHVLHIEVAQGLHKEQKSRN